MSRRSEMATKRRRKSNNPKGAPVTGKNAVRIDVSVSAELAARLDSLASRGGSTLRDVVRIVLTRGTDQLEAEFGAITAAQR